MITGRLAPLHGIEPGATDVHLVNLTPHPITLVTAETVVEIAPSGRIARCTAHPDQLVATLSVDGHPIPVVVHSTTPTVEGLPNSQPGVLLIVSRLVAAARPERRDLVFPHIAVRDDAGRTTGCRALAQVPEPHQ